MKPTKYIFAAALFCSLCLPLQAKLNVVATLPDFASIAQEIGGDKIDITALAKATEDPHFVDARPSFVVKLREADVLIDGGAELEIGWLPPLLQNARNPKIEVGKPGRVQAFEGIRLMNVPANVTRAAGDVHAMGNPHFAVDPIIAKAIAQHIATAFAAVDPPNAAAYQANYKTFEATINAKLQEWGAKLFAGQRSEPGRLSRFVGLFRAPLRIQHRYFSRAEAGHPAFTFAPDRSDCADEGAKIKVILVEPFHDRRIAEKVASATGAKVVDFAQFPGGLPGTDTYVKLIDTLVSRLAAALK